MLTVSVVYIPPPDELSCSAGKWILDNLLRLSPPAPPAAGSRTEAARPGREDC